MSEPTIHGGEVVTVAHIAALSEAEREALGWLCLGDHPGEWPGPARELARRGYLDGDDVENYTVPIAVHYAWCRWCSAQPDPEAHP